MRFAPSENLQTVIPLTSQEDKGYTLLDLHKPIIFDDLKHQIDQSKFFALHHLYTTDDVLICRKAEFLISLKNYDEAVITVSEVNHLLGTGILVKALTCLEAYNVVHEHCQEFYHWSNERCLQLGPLQQEGLIHVYEMAFIVAFEKRNFEFADYLLSKALFIAMSLGLTNRILTLEDQRLSLEIALGNTVTVNPYTAGNKQNAYRNAYLNLRASWLKGEPILNKFTQDFEPVTLGWHYLVEGRNHEALDCIRNLKTNNKEVKLFAQLIKLSCYSELNYSVGEYNVMMQNIEELLGDITHVMETVHDCLKLFPLASYLLSYKIDLFKAAPNSIALLSDKQKQDGIRLGESIIKLPSIFREVWLREDAQGRRGEKHVLSRSARHKVKRKLESEHLYYFNIVSTVKVYKALKLLSLAGIISENESASFSIKYPEVKKYTD